jgi:hypothetical protein
MPHTTNTAQAAIPSCLRKAFTVNYSAAAPLMTDTEPAPLMSLGLP